MTPQEWETFSDVNVSKAEKERSNSASLRALVENLLAQTAADMRRQHEAAGSALTLRIHETRSAKAALEDQLSKVHVNLHTTYVYVFSHNSVCSSTSSSSEKKTCLTVPFFKFVHKNHFLISVENDHTVA